MTKRLTNSAAANKWFNFAELASSVGATAVVTPQKFSGSRLPVVRKFG